MSNKKESYGPPLEEATQRITTGSTSRITTKQALQKPPSPLPTQNKYTPLTPMALPSFYPSSSLSPRALRPPPIQSKLISPLSFALNTPSTLNTPSSSNPEKRPYYTPPENLSCPFLEKDYKKILFIIEPEHTSEGSILQNITKFFPQGFHYQPQSLEKTRLFYEFILVDSESIELTHTYDKNDKNKIIFSKFKILKILSLSDWKDHPSSTKSFSRKFSPQNYSYYDYMDAWSNMLFIQPFDHSWFIWFRKDFELKFPNWFIKWFHECGPEIKIFPDFASEAFEAFSKTTIIPDYKKILYFHAAFGISWIVAWTYKKELSVTGISSDPRRSSIFWILRSFKIKWWSKFNPDLIKPSVLQSWFEAHPHYLIKPQGLEKEGNFLSSKSKILAELSSVSNKEEFLKKLQMALSESEDNGGDSSAAESPQDYAQINEDDCFGILDNLQD